jgi:hypothetical protein
MISEEQRFFCQSLRKRAPQQGAPMTRWTFFGRILPERIPLSMRMPEHRSEAAELALRYRATINIDKGQFIVPVVVESPKYEVLTLRNVVEGDIRTLTDLVGYRRGCSFDVDMISATCDDGRSVIFGNQIPVLQQSTARDAGPIEHELIAAIRTNVSAQIVLEDFREAMRSPVQTGFFCYRAIEAMMQSMKEREDEGDAPAWKTLRSRLNIDRSAIDAVKTHADDPRHGKASSITDSQRANVFRLTDELIRRYLIYLGNGKKTLPIDQFPTLLVS